MQFIGQLDFQALGFVQSIQADFLIRAFGIITFFGEWPIVLIVTAAISAFLIIKRKRIHLFILWLMVAGTATDVFLLKKIIHRQRPIFGVIKETSFSFPSAHSALSVALYGFIIYLLLQKAKSRVMKIIIVGAGVVFIFLIGFSRLYLNAHYLSDVLGGYILGAFWLGLGIYIEKRLIKKWTSTRQ